MLGYEIILRYYSGKIERHYIHAENHADAFEKAHRFCDPYAVHDGVQFIEPYRITKADAEKRKIYWED